MIWGIRQWYIGDHTFTSLTIISAYQVTHQIRAMGICEVRQITCCFPSLIHTVSHEIAKHIRYDNWCLGVFAVLLPLKCMA